MKFKELKKKTEKDLQALLLESRTSLREMRFKVANEQLKNIRELRVVKKTIAKIMFILGQNKKKQVEKINVSAKGATPKDGQGSASPRLELGTRAGRKETGK